MLWSTDTFKASQPRRCTVADAIDLFDLSLKGCVIPQRSEDRCGHQTGFAYFKHVIIMSLFPILDFFDSRGQMLRTSQRENPHALESVMRGYDFFLSASEHQQMPAEMLLLLLEHVLQLMGAHPTLPTLHWHNCMQLRGFGLSCD